MKLEFVKEIIRHEHISDIEINKVRDRIQLDNRLKMQRIT